MIDAMTRKPLELTIDDPTWPYLTLPLSQLDEVRRLLDKHGIRHWVEEHVISIDGAPEVATINFGRNAEVAPINTILDGV